VEKININSLIYNEILNLKAGCYSPVKEFMGRHEFLNVLKFYKTKNNKFFPLPLFFDIDEKQKQKIENRKKIKIFKNKIFLGYLYNFSFYKIDKNKVLLDFFGTSSTKHPGVKNFLNTKKYFIDGKIKLINHKLINKKIYPRYWKKLFKKKKIKSIAAFHTRNIPHRTHEWIHNFAQQKCKNLFIHPMTGKLKKGDFKRKVVIQSYKILLREKKNIYFSEFLSHARYAGPREAMLHALIRKNYGCSHFLIGRDHAGVGSFYKKYESQLKCKNKEKKIGINILAFKEPYYCKNCNKMNSTNGECGHTKKNKIFLSGTYIRKLIKMGKKIPSYYLNSKINKILNTNSLR
jgi:sulfate adenylyltransferase